MTDQPTLTETPGSSPNPTETRLNSGEVRPDCSECHGRVRPGKLCAGCGTDRTNEHQGTFITLDSLPYTPPWGRCCADFAVEIHHDFDAREPWGIWVLHTHSTECEVWQFL